EAERCYDEALQCFRASLDLDPENAELHYHRAFLLEDLERVDEAVEDYAAAASKSHSAEALVRLSALLLRLGRPADALVPADEAESRHPEDPRGWLAAAPTKHWPTTMPRSAARRRAETLRTGGRASASSTSVGRRRPSRRSTPHWGSVRRTRRRGSTRPAHVRPSGRPRARGKCWTRRSDSIPRMSKRSGCGPKGLSPTYFNAIRWINIAIADQGLSSAAASRGLHGPEDPSPRAASPQGCHRPPRTSRE